MAAGILWVDLEICVQPLHRAGRCPPASAQWCCGGRHWELSARPSAIILTGEIAACPLNSIADCLGVGIYSVAADLCKRFSFFILVVLYSHTFSHADSFVFPGCQTGAFSVRLQE